jgi:hypothetical protein
MLAAFPELTGLASKCDNRIAENEKDLFGTDLPLDLSFGNLREIVDHLELQLKG